MRCRRLLAILLFICVAPAFAGYDANITSKVTQILTYTGSGSVLFRLVDQPNSHPACNFDYFSIDASVPVDQRRQLLSRLMLAYSLGENVNIGYDSQGDCSNSRIRVHRVG